MRMIKTQKADGLISYLPYSEDAIASLQSTNKFGQPKQQMSVWTVDVDLKKNDIDVIEYVNEKITSSIFVLADHKKSSISESKLLDKSIELSERELELNQREEKLRKLEEKLKIQAEKAKNKELAHA